MWPFMRGLHGSDIFLARSGKQAARARILASGILYYFDILKQGKVATTLHPSSTHTIGRSLAIITRYDFTFLNITC
jgi:hypothetical protein